MLSAIPLWQFYDSNTGDTIGNNGSNNAGTFQACKHSGPYATCVTSRQWCDVIRLHSHSPWSDKEVELSICQSQKTHESQE